MKINYKTIQDLKKFLNINDNVHIIGVRASSSSEYGKWLDEIDIESKQIDHENMNCSFILIDQNKLMILQGSTTPHKKYLRKAIENNGKGANQLELGFYRYYSKGLHFPSEQTAHEALRQTRKQPVRRSSDNLSFDLNDRIEISNVNDNIHASWCNVNGKTHASAGCQVIAGYPDCKKRKGNTSHWKIFHDYIYSLKQTEFNYLLVSFAWLERIVNNCMKELIIFGSNSDKVKSIQKFFNLFQDGLYLSETYQKVLDFQKQNKLVIDGIVGLETLSKMGKI
jgi:peptidoglycan hydrolase-like protein with peptidoglycan-binding domain